MKAVRRITTMPAIILSSCHYPRHNDSSKSG